MTGAPQVRWDEAISFTSTISTPVPLFWVSVGRRVQGQAGVSRGRQYEWDQMQAGQYAPTLINQDGALSPVNTASPYWPNVTPRRPYRKQFQYPITPNILTTDQATGGSTQSGGAVVDTVVPAWISYGAFWHVASSATAFTGPNVFTQTISSGPTVPFACADMDGWSVIPGSPHSLQCVVRSSVSTTMRIVLFWRDVNGNVTSSVTGATQSLTGGSSTWTQLTVSGTAPLTAVGGTLQIQMLTSVGTILQASGFQVEYAAAPSAWATPGTWYYVINGWTDRWPMVTDKGGTYSLTQPIVLDSFARLAALYPPPPFYADVLALDPDFFYPLDDPALATSCRELTGNVGSAPVVNSPQGAGSLELGSGGTAGATSAGSFLGAPGPTAQFNNVDTGGSFFSPGTWVDLGQAGINGPPVSGVWTRMMAFQYSAISTNSDSSTIWASGRATFIDASAFGVFTQFSTGKIFVELVNGGTIEVAFATPANYADGQWHLLFLVVSNAGMQVDLYIDTTHFNIYTSATTPAIPLVTMASDTVGELVDYGSGRTNAGMQGNVAHIAQWPVALTVPQMTALFNSWRPAWSPEPSGERYQRILAWANYVGPQLIQGGNTLDMGPANDVDGQTDALTLLGNVVTTENGVHYVQANGTVRFEARGSRYDRLTPTFTFGSNVAGGEFPYADVKFDFDLDHVANEADVTINSTGQVLTASASSSQSQYDTLTLQRTINVVNPQEALDAADYLVNRYEQPLLRVPSLTLAPSRYSPDGGATFPLWAVCGQLEISTRIRVNHRPLGQPAITFDGFVENIAWTVDPTVGDTVVVVQCSPADLNLYWVLSALHTTVHTAATAGSNSVVLDALPDSASNPASASLCSGLQLTLDSQNPALSETLTVASFSATSPGYTTFTVTFTTNLAHNHAVNAVVCEQLPTGVTDPTTWDAASILGSTTTLAY